MAENFHKHFRETMKIDFCIRLILKQLIEETMKKMENRRKYDFDKSQQNRKTAEN